MKYLIYNNNAGLFWSNEDGWVDPMSATRFTPEERLSIPHLPGVGSEWIEEDSPEVTVWKDPDDEVDDHERFSERYNGGYGTCG